MNREVPSVGARPRGRGRARARPLAAARDLPRVRAARSAAPARGGARRRTRRRPAASDDDESPRACAPGSPADAARLGDGEAPVALSLTPPEQDEGELFAREQTWRFGVACGEEVVAGEVDDPADVVTALAARPVIAHDAKALGVVPPRLAHDTLLAAYLLDPARRGVPVPRAAARSAG